MWGWLKTYLISAGAVTLVTVTTASLLFFSLSIQSYLEEAFFLRTLWGVVDALAIWFIGFYYSKFATFLTEWGALIFYLFL